MKWLRKKFRKLRAHWRLFWHLCPECNSDAPDCDDCNVCCDWYGHHRGETFPPPPNVKENWRRKFLVLEAYRK